MAHAHNLTPWAEGQSGNPTGKPKGTLNRATILKRYLSAQLKANPADIPFELEGLITVEEVIILALIKKAMLGDVPAIREVLDTVYGKVRDTSEVTHTYTQMGRVIVNGKELEFDVGQPV